jgi:hypothetical protein
MKLAKQNMIKKLEMFKFESMELRKLKDERNME